MHVQYDLRCVIQKSLLKKIRSIDSFYHFHSHFYLTPRFTSLRYISYVDTYLYHRNQTTNNYPVKQINSR